MRSRLLCGASCHEAPQAGHLEGFSLRIKGRDVSEAISVSVALKRPDRSLGAIIASRASSFTDGSARVYISVVCMCACPSHSETLRRSLVACRTVSAQVCLNTCGDTRFVDSEGHRVVAVWTCLCRMYSKPERVRGSPRALRNSSGPRTVPLTAHHARSAAVVSFHNGRHRSRRPLPWTSTLACG
jgi:hypothetical protein